MSSSFLQKKNSGLMSTDEYNRARIPKDMWIAYGARVRALIKLYHQIDDESCPQLLVVDKRPSYGVIAKQIHEHETWRINYTRKVGQYNCELEKLARISQLFEWLTVNHEALNSGRRCRKVPFRFQLVVYDGLFYDTYKPLVVKVSKADGLVYSIEDRSVACA